VIVQLKKSAGKYLATLNEPAYSRIVSALEKLTNEPPSGDIVKLQDQKGYRLRVGGYRVMFDMTDSGITVYKIDPRGQAYKKANKRRGAK
jgi:mRNA interferase RelE/StbE